MRVTEMTADAFWKGEAKVKGIVEDQQIQYKATLHLKGSQVYDYSCSCEAGNSYKGMCAHNQALLEAYRAQVKDGAQTSVITSQPVRTMIKEYTNREVATILVEGEEERVELLPKLLVGRDGRLKAEFRIGRGRTYVIKDLIVFAAAMENGSFLEYGKSLAFHHNITVFTEESRPLAEFVVESVNTYREYSRQFQRGTFATSPTLRELVIGRGDRDRFFELMRDRELEMEDAAGVQRTVRILFENPDLEIQVARKGRDGIRVSIARDLFTFSGEQHLYVGDREELCRCGPECGDVLRVFLEQMTQASGLNHELDVNDRDIPLFYERVLKKIEPYGIVKSRGVDLESYRPQELRAIFEFDSAGLGELTMRPTLSYGDYSFHPVEDEKLPRTVCRDVPGEFRISQLITKYFKYREYETESLIIRDDEDAMYRLLSRGIEEFAAVGKVCFSEEFRKLKVLPSPQVSLGVRATGNWLELTVDAGEMSGEDLAKLLTEYTRKKRYCRLRGGEFLRLDDNGLMTIARMADELALGGHEFHSKTFRVPKYRALYLDAVLKEERNVTLYRDKFFKAVIRGMKSVEDSDYGIPPELDHVLREYQKVGYRWLRTLDAYGFGGILADDMGLGKTVQVIALLLDESLRNGNSTSLIVCPASLVYNWENEIRAFAPGLRVTTSTGNAQEREEKLKDLAKTDVLITSYDLLKRDIPLYEGKSFRYQIIDEAQYIKNARTQSARAVKAVEATTRFALTGTPVENRLGELWSIFDYLMPGFLFSAQRFKRDYEIPIARDGDASALERLCRLTGPFILRRLKQDVLRELPDKLETVVYSKFEEEQARLYAANAKLLKDRLGQEPDGRNEDRMQILAQLTRLRQICCDPSLCYDNYRKGSAKLETCVDLVRNAVSGGHKLLLFSQFTSMLDIIGSRLKKEEIPFFTLTGSTPKEERLRLVNAFSRDDVSVFLISLKAGGTGLNLTAADIVIHYDPWWNVAAQNQAADRAHRIGQSKQVTVFKLIAKNTVEENILALQESKKYLADQIISEGTLSPGSLSREELLELLR